MNTKTSKTAIVVAVIAALGTVGKSVIDARSNEKLQTVVAAEVARNEQRWLAVERLIEAQGATNKDITALRETAASLKATVQLLARNRGAAARDAAAGVNVPALPRPAVVKARLAADAMLNADAIEPAQVQMVRDQLFQ